MLENHLLRTDVARRLLDGLLDQIEAEAAQQLSVPQRQPTVTGLSAR